MAGSGHQTREWGGEMRGHESAGGRVQAQRGVQHVQRLLHGVGDPGDGGQVQVGDVCIGPGPPCVEVVLPVGQDLLVVLSVHLVPVPTLLVTVHQAPAALRHHPPLAGQEGGAGGAGPGEHEHVGLGLSQTPLEQHLGNVGDLETGAGALVQGVPAASHELQLGDEATEGGVSGLMGLQTLQVSVPDHVTPGAGDPGPRVAGVPHGQAHRAHAVIISLTKPETLGAADAKIHCEMCDMSIIVTQRQLIVRR